MNRGLARRPVFETRADLRTFQALLACGVRSRRLEIHAFTILTTHYHLLVRSPLGELSEALRLIQNKYVRWFNRTRRRDGALFRGRFSSRPVDSDEYFISLVRYIDHNPVQARLCSDPADYPHGSARHYARERGPPWLERTSIERDVARLARCPRFTPEAYARVFGAPPRTTERVLVEKRLATPVDAADPLDELLAAAPEQVLAWMQRKARLGDGTAIGLPVCDEESVVRVILAAESGSGPWTLPGVRSPSRAADGWNQARIVLLRDLAGATLAKIAARLEMSIASVSKAYDRHRRFVDTDAGYAQRMSSLASTALDTVHAASE